MTPPRVLVVGVYLAAQETLVDDVVARFGESRRYEVEQAWIALGGPPQTRHVADVTIDQVKAKTPKYTLLNRLLRQRDLERYEYLLICDDDVGLPPHFADGYLTLQASLDFRIAQPARTSGSYIDLPIVEQQRGVLARRTRFVEQGPVVSFHRSVFDVVLPFDISSPMGWGYENVWAHALARCGLRMGIIDCFAVEHAIRKPVSNYSWAHADLARRRYWANNPHLTMDECFVVLDVVCDTCG